MKTEKIYKRDGSIARFEPTKIATAIFKALSSQGRGDARLAKDLTQEAMALCENRFTKKIPTVEDIQDMVEEVLIRHGYPEVAKSVTVRAEKYNGSLEFIRNPPKDANIRVIAPPEHFAVKRLTMNKALLDHGYSMGLIAGRMHVHGLKE